MTREEAIEKYRNRLKGHSFGYASETIDALVDLGILKLDKPKTPDEKAMEIINNNLDARDFISNSPAVTGFEIIQWLKKAGLQIVER